MNSEDVGGFFSEKCILIYKSIRGHNPKYRNLNNHYREKAIKRDSVEIEIYVKINLKINVADSKQVSYRLQPVSGKEIRIP